MVKKFDLNKELVEAKDLVLELDNSGENYHLFLKQNSNTLIIILCSWIRGEANFDTYDEYLDLLELAQISPKDFSVDPYLFVKTATHILMGER